MPLGGAIRRGCAVDSGPTSGRASCACERCQACPSNRGAERSANYQSIGVRPDAKLLRIVAVESVLLPDGDTRHRPYLRQSSAPISGLDFRTNKNRGDEMKAADYARMAEECSRQADAMRPSSERDALMEKARLPVLCQNGQLGHFEGVAAAQLAIQAERYGWRVWHGHTARGP